MFNFEVFAANILAAAANAIKNNYTVKVKEFLEQTLESKQERLREIATAVINKEIDLVDVPAYAKVELNIAESELIAIGILTATEAQEMINAIVDKAVAIYNDLMPQSGE